MQPCTQCRKAKRRCVTVEGRQPCLLCMQRRRSCSRLVAPWPGSGTVTAVTAPLLLSPSETSPASRPLSADVAIALVDLYICYMHDKPHALFHEPSLREAVANGSISQVVLFSILGLAARYASLMFPFRWTTSAEPFSNLWLSFVSYATSYLGSSELDGVAVVSTCFSEDAEIQRQGPHFTETAKSLLKSDLEHACVEIIQACILIGNICLGDSDPDAESLYFVLANRMAQIAKLNVLTEADDGITRETKLRLWWTCYLTDTWASGGLGLPRQFSILNSAPRLPMDEETFWSMRPGDPDVPSSRWKPGFWGYNVKLASIYSTIADFTKFMVQTSTWNEEEIEDTVRELSVQLTAFEESLPLTMRYSSANLTLQVQRGLGRQFVALHLALNHYYTLLFYQYLDRNRPTTTNSKAYAERCKQHALLFCDILSASRTHGGAEALYNIVGHVTVVSSSVLLHSFLFGNPDEVAHIRRRLESNFESLVQLRKLWPSVELMTNRLVVFQQRCLQSEMSNTHRLNKWMVKFLLQHALALDEDDDDGNLDHPASSSYRDLESPTSNTSAVGRLIERSRVAESIIMDMRMRRE